MSRARTLADLLDSSGDVKSANLDNAAITNLSSTASGIDISGDLQVDSGTSSNIIIEKNNTGGASLRFHNEGSQLSYIQLDASEDMIHYGGYGVNQIIYAGGYERMRISSTGNMGLGAIPESAAGVITTFESGAGSSFMSYSTTYPNTYIGTNVKANAYGIVHKGAGAGNSNKTSLYTQTSNGKHLFKVGGSGIAGYSISWTDAMSIDNTGNVEMGGDLDVSGNVTADPTGGGVVRVTRTLVSANYLQLEHDGTNGTISSSADTIFRNNGAERLRITSTGNAEFAGKVSTPHVTLDAIDASITGNAVDIFIYDTSKDSDGGAWRKRTQHTSWYNETASATRSSRKEFPAVAVIVVEQSSHGIKIYDGDTPDLALWAHFTELVWNGSDVGGSLAAKNGQIVVGFKSHLNYSGQGLSILNFVADTYILESWNITYSGQSGGYQSGLVSSKIYKDFGSGVRTYNLVNLSINDIAITVLPNAPIDSATGLPIPTIATCHKNAISIIKDNGSVVYITGSPGDSMETVEFNTNYEVVASNYWGTYVAVWDIPNAGTVNQNTYNRQYKSSSSTPAIPYGVIKEALPLKDDILAVHDTTTGSDAHGYYLIKENTTTPSKGSVAYITSKYNTGYMTGDIRGAWNVDTDVTSLSGTELVSNGTFDTNTTGFTTNAEGAISVDTGRLKVENVTDRGRFYHSGTFALVTGRTYVLTFDNETGSVAGFFHIDKGDGTVVNNLSDADSPYTFIATGTAGDFEGGVLSTVVGDYTYFDNISVREAIPDRSVKGNGLAVHGTPTVSAVATGAELKCISGFTDVIYLSQPYNSDLDFGTGDFSISGWLKGTDSYGVFCGTNHTSTYTGFSLSLSTSYYLYLGSSSVSVSSPAATSNTWVNLVVTRNNGVVYIYENGELLTSAANTTSIVNGGALVFGYRPHDNAQNYQGQLALWRISATAPTAEQIKEIYEAEKPMFQENAKCTLNGSSDAVTALAYDDSTELLHVGTSGGRSTFQGLRRVAETSTSTTEIAAQGGLIVEET